MKPSAVEFITDSADALGNSSGGSGPGPPEPGAPGCRGATRWARRMKPEAAGPRSDAKGFGARPAAWPGWPGGTDPNAVGRMGRMGGPGGDGPNAVGRMGRSGGGDAGAVGPDGPAAPVPWDPVRRVRCGGLHRAGPTFRAPPSGPSHPGSAPGGPRGGPVRHRDLGPRRRGARRWLRRRRGGPGWPEGLGNPGPEWSGA